MTYSRTVLDLIEASGPAIEAARAVTGAVKHCDTQVRKGQYAPALLTLTKPCGPPWPSTRKMKLLLAGIRSVHHRRPAPALARAQRPGCRGTRERCVVQLLVNIDENGAVFNLACVNRDGAAGKYTDGLAGGQVVA